MEGLSKNQVAAAVNICKALLVYQWKKQLTCGRAANLC